MKILILLSLTLFLGACSQDSSSSPKQAAPQGQISPAPTPVEGSAGESADHFWKSKKVSCSTRYQIKQYYQNTSVRFQGDKMLSILDVKSWDNNSPGSSYRNTFTMNCAIEPHPTTGVSMIVCEESTSGMLIAKVVFQRNALDEIKADVYVDNHWSEDGFCSIENLP